MYYIYLENGKLNGAGQARQLNEGVENIEVTEEVFNAYIETPEKYIYSDGEIVENPDYEKLLYNQRKKGFNKEFFNTSLGYIRRNVTMSTGEIKDFLSDLLPTISMGINLGQPVPIITYKEPDFSQDLTEEYMVTLQNRVNATAEFVQECFEQLSNDFTGGINKMGEAS